METIKLYITSTEIYQDMELLLITDVVIIADIRIELMFSYHFSISTAPINSLFELNKIIKEQGSAELLLNWMFLCNLYNINNYSKMERVRTIFKL